jgi:hypothetical protein
VQIWIVAVSLFLFGVGSFARAQAPIVVEPAAAASSAAASAPAPARSGAPRMFREPIQLPSTPAQIAIPDLRAPTVTVTSPPGPTFLPNCDSSGCWGSDGIRYNAIGGVLMRPDGRMCQNFNGLLQCP